MYSVRALKLCSLVAQQLTSSQQLYLFQFYLTFRQVLLSSSKSHFRQLWSTLLIYLLLNRKYPDSPFCVKVQSNKCQLIFSNHLYQPVLTLKVFVFETSQKCSGLLLGTNNKNINTKFEPFFPWHLHSNFGHFLSLLKLGRPKFYEKLRIPSFFWCTLSNHVVCKALWQSFLLVSAYSSIPCGCFVLLDRCVHSAQNFAL